MQDTIDASSNATKSEVRDNGTNLDYPVVGEASLEHTAQSIQPMPWGAKVSRTTYKLL